MDKLTKLQLSILQSSLVSNTNSIGEKLPTGCVMLPNQKMQSKGAMRQLREMGYVVQEIRDGFFANWITEAGKAALAN